MLTKRKTNSGKKVTRKVYLDNNFRTVVANLLTLTILGLIITIIFVVDPDTFAIVPLFLIILLIGLDRIFSKFVQNKRLSLTIATAIVFFLLLSYLGIGNILNLLLIVGVIASIEIYLSK